MIWFAAEFFVAPIAVGMHDAAEACKMVSRMRPLRSGL